MKIIFIILLSISCSAYSAEISYDRIYKENFILINKSTNLPIAGKTAKLITEYDKYFSPGRVNCKTATQSDLHARFMAANMLAGYTMFSHFEKNLSFVKDMEVCLLKLSSAGMARDKDFNDLFGAYLSARKFQSAQLLAEKNPKIAFPRIPKVRFNSTFVENHQSVISLMQDNNIVADSLRLSPHAQIVIVSGCHFALDALRFVESNDKLKEGFRKANAVWLVPADRDLDMAGFKEINNSFPDAFTYLAYKNSSWPEIDFSISPNFYFYKNGQLIKKLEGWSNNGIPEEVLNTLKNMDLLR